MNVSLDMYYFWFTLYESNWDGVHVESWVGSCEFSLVYGIFNYFVVLGCLNECMCTCMCVWGSNFFPLDNVFMVNIVKLSKGKKC